MKYKLTDEQKQRIKNLSSLGAAAFVKIPIRGDDLCVSVQIEYDERLDEIHFVMYSLDFHLRKACLKSEELFPHIEEVLNRKYFYLPTCKAWIMSGEVYRFKDAGKVLELVCLAESNGIYIGDLPEYSPYEQLGDWYTCNGIPFNGYPEPREYQFGVIIPINSPVWKVLGEYYESP